MSYSRLYGKDAFLEDEIASTLGSRPYDKVIDTRALARLIMLKFDIKLKPFPEPLRLECWGCNGVGKFITPLIREDGTTDSTVIKSTTCTTCSGKRYVESFR